MITVDFCIAFIQMLPRPIRRKADMQLVDVAERGISNPPSSIFQTSDIYSMFDNRSKFKDGSFESTNSPVIVYAKVYAFVMENQNEFIERLKNS